MRARPLAVLLGAPARRAVPGTGRPPPRALPLAALLGVPVRGRSPAGTLLGTLALAAFLGALPLAAQPAAPVAPPGAPPVLDFALEEAPSGRTRTLAEARGRLVILFYEDRDHAELNLEFKELLHRFVLDNHLEADTRMYAVADLSSVGGGLVRDLARAAIAAVASRYQIQILLDWDGALQAAPFSFAAHDATTALLDREGRLRFRHTGAIGPDERRAFFAALRQLLRAS